MDRIKDSDSLPFYFLNFGISLLAILSAFGTCEAITAAATSSIPNAQRKSLLTHAYVAIIMTSTIFMYGLILALTIIFRISENYQTDEAIKHAAACLFYGLSAFFCGKAMANACTQGFPVVARNTKFFFHFILMLSGVEVVLIFGLIVSLMIITSK